MGLQIRLTLNYCLMKTNCMHLNTFYTNYFNINLSGVTETLSSFVEPPLSWIIYNKCMSETICYFIGLNCENDQQCNQKHLFKILTVKEK